MKCDAPGCRNGKIRQKCSNRNCHSGKIRVSESNREESRCSVCFGSGTVPHFLCGGSGTRWITGGNGRSRMVDCRGCRGGIVPCTKCHGTGKEYQNNRSSKEITCPTCRGQSKLVNCQKCRGTGQINISNPSGSAGQKKAQTSSVQKPRSKYGHFYNENKVKDKSLYATWYKIGFDAAMVNRTPNFNCTPNEDVKAGYRDGYRAGRS